MIRTQDDIQHLAHQMIDNHGPTTIDDLYQHVGYDDIDAPRHDVVLAVNMDPDLERYHDGTQEMVEVAD